MVKERGGGGGEKELIINWLEKIKEGAKVSEHLNTFNDILSQLESIGVKMDDEDKAVTLLCTLPDSYDNLVTT